MLYCMAMTMSSRFSNSIKIPTSYEWIWWLLREVAENPIEKSRCNFIIFYMLMKKFYQVVVIVVALLCSGMSFAQNAFGNRDIRYSGMINIGGGPGMYFHVNKDVNALGSITIHTTHGILFKERFFVGTGLGFCNGFNADNNYFMSLPIYGTMRAYFSPLDPEERVGYVDMKVGSYLVSSTNANNLDKLVSAGGLFLQTGIGLTIKKFDMGFNYELRKFNDGNIGLHGVFNATFGLCF